MAFEIKIGSAEPVAFSAIGATKLRRKQSSQSAGSFAFSVTTDCDLNALGGEGTVCTVYNSGAPFFTGRLYKIPRRGSARAESIDYQILDPWNDFQRNVYQEQWNRITGVDEHGDATKASEFRSEIILGMDENGTQLNSGTVIANIVAWAISVGAICQIGVIDVSATFPLDEVNDLPCSECIKKMLRWTPDAVAYFDHSQVPPVFNVVRRGSMGELPLPFAGNAENIQIEARPDLVVPSVVIRYLQESQSDHLPVINTIVDDWPSGASGLEYGALVQTVRLAGTQSSFQKAPVKVNPIPIANSANDGGGPSNDPTIQFWQRNTTWLKAFDGNQLVITNVNGVYDVGQGDDDGSGLIEVSAADYPNFLIQGSLASWMDVNWALTTWTANGRWSYPEDPGSYSDLDWQAVTVFGPDDGSGNSPAVILSCKVTATSAATKTYEQLSSYTQAEPVPSGLAQELYESLSVLHYEGSYTSIADEVGDISLGVVLNITGGRAEWAGMNALVQEIEDDLDGGRTTVRFGPPSHLTLQNLMEQLRGNRTRTISSHIQERQTGTPGEPPIVNSHEQGVVSNGSSPPSQSSPPWFDSIVDQSAGTGESATYDVLFGFGQSSFANSGGIDHAAPIEKLEISVGNDGSEWTGSSYGSDSDDWGFSLQSGNDDAEDDILCIGTSNGSVSITPNDPSLYLCGDINADDADDDTPHISIDFGDMLIEMQDEDGSTISLDLSGSPEMTIYNANTGSTSTLDENSLSLSDSGSGGFVSIDASGTDGNAISWQTVSVCVDGTQKSMLVLGSAPF